MTARDIAIRALKTAIQSGLAVVVGAQAGFYDVATWKAAATAAIAAGLSVIGNALHTSEDKAAVASGEAKAITYDNTLTLPAPSKRDG